MKAVTVSFDYKNNEYNRLLEVLIKSWDVHHDIPLDVHRLPLDPRFAEDIHQNGLWRNHMKLRKWIDSVDQDTILLDCDMLCMGDMTSGFEGVKHIGITHRGGPYPYNGGVVFVRDTPESKAFLAKWYEIDERMLNDPSLHDPYKAKYAGINQSSMGWMMENGYDHLVTILPCATYNLCQPWDNWKQARMIHIKSGLRKACLNPPPRRRRHRFTPRIRDMREIWSTYDGS